MNPTTITLLYSDSPTIGFPELEKIIQSVALYSDKVWLHGGLSISPQLSEGERGFIRSQLTALVEHGFVALWEFEGVRPNPSEDLLARQIRAGRPFHIGSDAYDEIREGVKVRISDFTRKIRALPLSQTGEARGAELVEGSAELVHLRSNLWPSLVANHLGADGLLVYPARWQRLRAEFEFFYSGTEHARTVQHCFSEISSWRGLSGFSFIDVDELDSIRDMFPDFRRFVIGGIGPVSLALGSETQLQQKIEELKIKFTRELEVELKRRIPSWWQLVHKQLGSAAVSIASSFIPPLSALGNAGDFLSWLRSRKRGKHLLYLIELEQRLGKTQSTKATIK